MKQDYFAVNSTPDFMFGWDLSLHPAVRTADRANVKAITKRNLTIRHLHKKITRPEKPDTLF